METAAFSKVKRKLPQGVRGIIYSYLTLMELINKISRLSKSDRSFVMSSSELLE